MRRTVQTSRGSDLLEFSNNRINSRRARSLLRRVIAATSVRSTRFKENAVGTLPSISAVFYNVAGFVSQVSARKLHAREFCEAVAAAGVPIYPDFLKVRARECAVAYLTPNSIGFLRSRLACSASVIIAVNCTMHRSIRQCNERDNIRFQIQQRSRRSRRLIRARSSLR
jgi:hypothetical protein